MIAKRRKKDKLPESLELSLQKTSHIFVADFKINVCRVVFYAVIFSFYEMLLTNFIKNF